MASEPIAPAHSRAEVEKSYVRDVVLSILGPLVVAAIVALATGYIRDQTTSAAFEQRLETVEVEQKKMGDYHETLIRLDERLLSIDRRLERLENKE